MIRMLKAIKNDQSDQKRSEMIKLVEKIIMLKNDQNDRFAKKFKTIKNNQKQSEIIKSGRDDKVQLRP